MDTFFGRYKDILVLFFVLFAQFLGLATQIRHPLANGQDRHNVRLWRYWVVALVAPPEKVLQHVGSGTRGFWSNYVDLRDTRVENQQLLAEVNRLHLEQAGLLEDAREGQRLQALLSFKQQYVYQTEPAQVIGTAGTDQSRLLYINKGTRDGLRPDMPVITPDGVVGKLKDVFQRTAQLQLINDETSGAGVLLQTTRLRGVLRGNAFGQPQIINILPDERIKAGEPVVTSGGDQVFPRGLPVGTVESVASDPEHEPYVDVIIKPAANLAHLEEVLVVTQTGDRMPAVAARDLAKSEAASAVDAEKQRASDVLAQKLPGYIDPEAPVDPDESPVLQAAAGEIGRPIKPLQPLHPDRYSPDGTPPAASLTPGAVSHRQAGMVDADGSVVPVTPKPRPKPKLVDPDGEPAGTLDPGTGVKPRVPRPTLAAPITPTPSPAHTDEEPPTVQQAQPSPVSPQARTESGPRPYQEPYAVPRRVGQGDRH